MASTDVLIDVLVGERLGEPSTAQIQALQLPATADAPGQARLMAWSAWPALSDDDMAILSLLTSELVTNAVLHARTPMTCGIAVTADLVLVVVGDNNPVLPEPSKEPGRGLHLVASLASSWGVRPGADGGKAVWFTLSRQHT